MSVDYIYFFAGILKNRLNYIRTVLYIPRRLVKNNSGYVAFVHSEVL